MKTRSEVIRKEKKTSVPAVTAGDGAHSEIVCPYWSYTPLRLLLPRLHPGNGRKQLCPTFPLLSHLPIPGVLSLTTPFPFPAPHGTLWLPPLGIGVGPVRVDFHPSEWPKRAPTLLGRAAPGGGEAAGAAHHTGPHRREKIGPKSGQKRLCQKGDPGPFEMLGEIFSGPLKPILTHLAPPSAWRWPFC